MFTINMGERIELTNRDMRALRFEYDKLGLIPLLKFKIILKHIEAGRDSVAKLIELLHELGDERDEKHDTREHRFADFIYKVYMPDENDFIPGLAIERIVYEVMSTLYTGV
jgi:hypothetical protein